MLRRTVLFALALFTGNRVLAQAPDVPHGGGACTNDWDCSLGGICASNYFCECDIWFTGSTCAQLNLVPADPDAHGIDTPGYFSWGGHPLQDENGTYHLLTSFLCDHATLSSWTTKSSIAHATALTPTGPFTFAAGDDAQLVVPPWSHGAIVTQDPVSKKYLLFHIGNGLVAPSTWSPCYNSSENTPAFASFFDASPPPLPFGSGESDHTYVEQALTLAGPWTSFANNSGLVINYPAGSWATSSTNPAPFIFENGTTLLFYRADQCPKTWGALAPACIGVAIADSWEGPYTSLFDQPITHPEGEDPSVFRDPRGNFHMLTNVNTYHARCAAGVPCGGHAWSKDALTWSNQTVGAFGPVIRWRNGSYFSGAYAERPQVFQAADGTPVAFYTGFGMHSYSDSHNFAQRFCSAADTQCGPTQAPAGVHVRFTQGGASRCLVANASTYPCAGGHAESCPLAVGTCDDTTAVWIYSSVTGQLGNAAATYAGRSFLSLDCGSCTTGTLAKVIDAAHFATAADFDAAAGVFRARACPGMCLSIAVNVTRKRPCEGGEWTVGGQAVLVDCNAAEAVGWVMHNYDFL
jgi:hypothetical protein